MRPPLVSVRWKDAHATAGTTAYELHELPHKASEILSYGLLLRDDADGISIASEDAGAGMFRGITFVPRALVVEVKPVTRARKKKAALDVQHD